MINLANLPYLTVRVPVVFFEDFTERCDAPECFEVESTEGRNHTISAPADGVLELYADALCTADPRTAPVGTEAHVRADARRAVSLLDASASWLRRDAAVLAGRKKALELAWPEKIRVIERLNQATTAAREAMRKAKAGGPSA